MWALSHTTERQAADRTRGETGTALRAELTSSVVPAGHNAGLPPTEGAVCTLTSVCRVTGRSSTRCLCKKGCCVRTCTLATGRVECESCLLGASLGTSGPCPGWGGGDHLPFRSCCRICPSPPATDWFRDPNWANQISYNEFSMARGETQR